MISGHERAVLAIVLFRRLQAIATETLKVSTDYGQRVLVVRSAMERRKRTSV